MQFPEYRARRVRGKASTRALVGETVVRPAHLIARLRVCAGAGGARQMDSSSGAGAWTAETIDQPVAELKELGVSCLMIASAGDQRDELAKHAVRKDGAMARSIARARELERALTIIAELDPADYTRDGLGGVEQKGELDNDATLELLAEMALVCARAGADFVAPAASMDGQVGWLREALDEEGLSQVGIVPCSARYDSAFAGPPQGRRGELTSTCLLGPGNVREAMRAATLDVEEGADMLMVRPAGPFLDVISRLAEEFELPLLGVIDDTEYAMIEAAARAGVVQREEALVERVLAVRRAGADAVVTPFAADVARALGR